MDSLRVLVLVAIVAIVLQAVLVLTLKRIREHHAVLWKELGSPSLWAASISSPFWWRNASILLWRRDWLERGDSALARWLWTYRVIAYCLYGWALVITIWQAIDIMR